MSTNVIQNGDFENYFDNWGGNDNEIGSFAGGTPQWTEDTYLQNGSSNTLAEMDGHSGQTTVLEQDFTIGSPIDTDVTFDYGLRSNADPGDGFLVEVLDSNGNVIASETVMPTEHVMSGYSIPVSFTTSGTYTLRFTEVGNDNSLGALLDNVSIIACFTRGALIETIDGERLIEDLQPGNMVRTKDNGFQPIRWIGSSKRVALGNMAPILIRKGALGNTRDLKVSPNHRMMLSDWRAELLFNQKEVLVPAKDLVNDQTIIRMQGGEVEYFHMMFDQHEIVFAQGCPSESFYPAQLAVDGIEEATRAEILELFPQLARSTESYGPEARISLLPHEIALLQG